MPTQYSELRKTAKVLPRLLPTFNGMKTALQEEEEEELKFSAEE